MGPEIWRIPKKRGALIDTDRALSKLSLSPAMTFACVMGDNRSPLDFMWLHSYEETIFTMLGFLSVYTGGLLVCRSSMDVFFAVLKTAQTKNCTCQKCPCFLPEAYEIVSQNE